MHERVIQNGFLGADRHNSFKKNFVPITPIRKKDDGEPKKIPTSAIVAGVGATSFVVWRITQAVNKYIAKQNEPGSVNIYEPIQKVDYKIAVAGYSNYHPKDNESKAPDSGLQIEAENFTGKDIKGKEVTYRVIFNPQKACQYLISHNNLLPTDLEVCIADFESPNNILIFRNGKLTGVLYGKLFANVGPTGDMSGPIRNSFPTKFVNNEVTIGQSHPSIQEIYEAVNSVEAARTVEAGFPLPDIINNPPIVTAGLVGIGILIYLGVRGWKDYTGKQTSENIGNLAHK